MDEKTPAAELTKIIRQQQRMGLRQSRIGAVALGLGPGERALICTPLATYTITAIEPGGIAGVKADLIIEDEIASEDAA